METISKMKAMFYARLLEDEVYHIFNIIDNMGCGNEFPTEIRESIIHRTKTYISNINVQLSL